MASTVTMAEGPGGAQLIHLLCPRERENFFSVCFRTPPPDDSGIPHILEHTVLNGSRKYPVKDPFMNMVRSSMATFINAMTYGDRTVYPCGSLDRRDFLNLISVYMDAVFHPLLRREFFLQEGYRLEWDHSEDRLVHGGVVYNEMAGAYSDPDTLMERETARALFPEGTGGLDSGGDPDSIRKLAFDRFRKYHDDHYGPDNCCITAITRIPFDEFASSISGMIPSRSGNPGNYRFQKDFSVPVRKILPVPSQEGDCAIRAWKVNRAGDPVESLAFSLLEDILLDSDTSPVRAALLDSGLGSGLSICGYDADLPERTFLIGLKGMDEDSSDKVFCLVEETLKALVEKGIPSRLTEGMLHRKELQLRYTGAGWPLAVTGAVTAAWAHGESIMETLDLTGLITNLRSRMTADSRFLEGMTRRWLLDNPNRVDMVFRSDPEEFRRREDLRNEELKRLQSSLGKPGITTLRTELRTLHEHMDSPDSPDDLARLPRLDLKKIPPPRPVPRYEAVAVDEITMLRTSMDTSGLCYIDVILDMSDLHPGLVPFLSVYSGAVTRTGAGGLSHVEMAERELACSSGISCSVKCVTSTVDSIDTRRLLLRFSGYCLSAHLPDLLSVLGLRITGTDMEDKGRIRSATAEMLEEKRSELIPAGHTFALLEARAGLSAGHSSANELFGVPSVKLLERMKKEGPDGFTGYLTEVRDHIQKGVPVTVAYTGSMEDWETLLKCCGELPRSSGRNRIPQLFQGSPVSRTGILAPSVTCFAGASLPGIPMSHPLAPSASVAMHMLSEGFIWDVLRVKGGAYGGGAGVSGGAFNLYSYRDPTPALTLEIFAGIVSGALEKLDLSRRSVEDSIIARLKGLDPPVRPAMANGMAISAHFRDLGPESVRKHGLALMAVEEGSIRDFTALLAQRSDKMRSCVLGGEECLERAKVEEVISV